MKAFGFNQFGDPDVFETLDVPIPAPKKGRVLVQTRAFAMNPFDSKMRQGSVSSKKPPVFPTIPGSDVAGTVVSKAPDVTDFEVGDAVFGRVFKGAYAEFVSVPHLKLVKKPANLSFGEAAGIPNAGITAFDILKSAVSLENATSILVLGASGAVGAFTTQIAKAMGLFVAATASVKHTDFVNRLGVDLFIPVSQLAQRNFLDHAPVDILIDATPHPYANAQNSLRWLKAGGQLVALNDFSPDFTTQDHHLIAFNDAVYHQNKKALIYLSELVTHNQLKINLAKQLPFTVEGVIAGQKLLDSHHAPGKIVVTK
ncbi:NADP-dependent oxidoreductase [Pediococcus siamensis]|uniref:NADP-dependent oxidoreductase n=1 Tax=Pediococcus siamensis TaxID=381829 RepID=UPI0039A04FE1